MQPCLLPWVAQLPALPHSALSGTGLQSMTHMPAPAPSPLQPSDSSPLLFATTKSHLGLVLLGYGALPSWKSPLLPPPSSLSRGEFPAGWLD